MYSWGAGTNGQLGTGRLQDAVAPEPVLWDQEAPFAIACGGNHVVALTGMCVMLCTQQIVELFLLQRFLLCQVQLLGFGVLLGLWGLLIRHPISQTQLVRLSRFRHHCLLQQ